MVEPIDGWPELTYRYVKHYFWEPQHMVRTARTIAEAEKRGLSRIEAVDRKVRTQEVPLNYLLNVLLRLAPASVRRACIRAFGINVDEDPGLASLVLRTPQDTARIQPDVHLESERSRVFMELKVEARLGLPQLQKYANRHADLNAAPAQTKRSYVLVLVKRELLKLIDDTGTAHSVQVDEFARRIPMLLEPSTVVFGAARWSSVADVLTEELENRHGAAAETVEMLDVLVKDFLVDLRSRGLAS